jgi:CRP/FNR family transcriptional regulator
MDEMVKCRDCEFKSSAAKILDNEQIQTLEKYCALASFQQGEAIFKENALSSNIIYIRTGLVKIHLSGPAGEHILSIKKAPSYLGIPTTFGDRVNHYSATALTETTACFIDIEIFREFIASNGGFAYEIILNLCDSELQHFRRCVNRVQKHMHGRIADALLYFSQVIFKDHTFNLPLSRNDLGDLTNVSREGVSRVLSEFHQDQIIDIKGKRIKILNLESLSRVSRNG